MATAQNLLFSWDAVDQLPDLKRLRMILEALPDETLLAALEARRGRGRNDSYEGPPVKWRSLRGLQRQARTSVCAYLRDITLGPHAELVS